VTAVDANGQQTVDYKYPRDDINAPDLYIPIMSFITFILLMGLALGVYHRFTPETLSATGSSALAILIFEVCVCVCVCVCVYLVAR